MIIVTEYARAKERRAWLEAEYDRASRVLNALSSAAPGAGAPDHVRATAEWKAAKHAMDVAFAALRAFNATYVRRFKLEMAQERRNKG